MTSVRMGKNGGTTRSIASQTSATETFSAATLASSGT
jgi:hypothetical protein